MTSQKQKKKKYTRYKRNRTKKYKGGVSTPNSTDESLRNLQALSESIRKNPPIVEPITRPITKSTEDIDKMIDQKFKDAGINIESSTSKTHNKTIKKTPRFVPKRPPVPGLTNVENTKLYNDINRIQSKLDDIFHELKILKKSDEHIWGYIYDELPIIIKEMIIEYNKK